MPRSWKSTDWFSGVGAAKAVVGTSWTWTRAMSAPAPGPWMPSSEGSPLKPRRTTGRRMTTCSLHHPLTTMVRSAALSPRAAWMLALVQSTTTSLAAAGAVADAAMARTARATGETTNRRDRDMESLLLVGPEDGHRGRIPACRLGATSTSAARGARHHAFCTVERRVYRRRPQIGRAHV